MHYPRSSAQEWGPIMRSMRDNGINLLQTYVFWNLHEKVQGNYVFTGMSEENEDIIAFLTAAKEAGLYVNLRFGPYVCAEWNYGGIPVWTRDLTHADGQKVTFRTDDELWMKQMLAFVDATIVAVDSAKLFAGLSDGPIVMLQIENEYGNVQDIYGQGGADYVQKLTDYVRKKPELNLPWIMCQQGEGVGTAPSSGIINTCNGFYCDNWIAGHAAAFPDQPHMFTENWPGWFQKWGEAVPHRPAVDVAFSVMRWFAKGGSFMNYYMAFGGTSFARTVGGPGIVTSYDYDVAVNEYGMQAEPKFSLQQQMHSALYASQNAIFGTATVPVAVPLNNSTTCESHTYSSHNACAVFLSNTGSQECSFDKVTVPGWSVTLMAGAKAAECDAAALTEIFNSKTAVGAANQLAAASVPITITLGKSLREKIPSSGRLSTHFSHMTPVQYLESREPKQQLDVTHDRTDYIWYSTIVKVGDTNSTETADTVVGNLFRKEKGTLKFDVGTGAGARCRLWLNEKEVIAAGNKNSQPHHFRWQKQNKRTSLGDAEAHVPYRYDIKLSKNRPNTLDILCIGAGLQNYGPNLELIETGIVGHVTLNGEELLDWKHSVGLLGEAIDYGGVSTISTIDPAKRAELIHDLEGHYECTDLCWRQLTFVTEALVSNASYALDLGTLGKGAVWVNGHMLGRYSNAIASASDSGVCVTCDESTYVGEYQPDSQCRTGCGELSQRYYKVPTDWLKSNGEANEVILFEEEIGISSVEHGLKLIQITSGKKISL